ncbi:hypothetical protein KSZ_66700 [Dictyobacter formicarum]|uniref:Uncharacterized protein n=1 Tax=Dictyobacter formicarum TaxID=2778368 RepID=A0ABQ3VQX0_9CHLR|nr:hypothetical protein KSZ_66700 [Dictyobacter formicarum]
MGTMSRHERPNDEGEHAGGMINRAANRAQGPNLWAGGKLRQGDDVPDILASTYALCLLSLK